MTHSTAVPATTDHELVRRFTTGDESAFSEIVERYRARIYSVALGMIHDRADAEEIAQDTFVRAYRNLAKFRYESSLATWLHRITVNLARNRYWYFFRRRRHLSISLDQPLGEDSTETLGDFLPATSVAPEQERSEEEFSQVVGECMERLPRYQREILVLRSVRDLSYEEIAGRLNLEVGTVKSRIGRAREKLRELIAERTPEFMLRGKPTLG